MKIKRLIVEDWSGNLNDKWQWVYVQTFCGKSFSACYEYSKRYKTWIHTKGENEIISPTDEMLDELWDSWNGRIILNEDGTIKLCSNTK